MPDRVAKRPSQAVQRIKKQVVSSVKHRLGRKRIMRGHDPSEENILRLSGLLALLRGDPEAEQIQRNVLRLFIGKRGRDRTQYWGSVLDDFPAEPEMIRRLHRCVRAHDRHARAETRFSVEEDRLKLDNVVEAMLEIPKPDIYVRHCTAKGAARPRIMFHPNTLEAMRDDLRGLRDYDGGARDDSLLGEVPVD